MKMIATWFRQRRGLAIGAVVDHGDGSYSVPLGPSTTVGRAKLRVVVDDGQGAVQLDAKRIKISGCILGGLLCKSQIWKKI